MSNIALLEQTVKNIVSPGFRLSIKYNDPVVFQEYGSRYQETIESHNIYNVSYTQLTLPPILLV